MSCITLALLAFTAPAAASCIGIPVVPLGSTTITGNGTGGQTIATNNATSLYRNGLNIAPDGTATVQFSLDVCNSCFGYAWILQEASGNPNVPTPNTCALLAPGLFTLALRARQTNR